LIVEPYYDDLEIGCGSTIAKLVSNILKDKVQYFNYEII